MNKTRKPVGSTFKIEARKDTVDAENLKGMSSKRKENVDAFTVLDTRKRTRGRRERRQAYARRREEALEAIRRHRKELVV